MSEMRLCSVDESGAILRCWWGAPEEIDGKAVLDASDPLAVEGADYAQVLQAVEVKTRQDTIGAYEASVQAWLDAGAQAYGYDGILSAASYATSTHPRFGPQGVAFRDWRDAVWGGCYAILNAVQSGKRAAPDIDALLAELPPAPVFS